MWRCCNCGAQNHNRAVCTACGRPIDEAFCKINLKIQELSFQGSAEDRWIGRGRKTGFFVGLVLSPVLIPVILYLNFLPWKEIPVTPMSVIPLLIGILMLVLEIVFVSTVLFQVLYLILGAVKPIWVALFCNIKRFEQEYGSTKQ